jgi:hypothetical protein
MEGNRNQLRLVMYNISYVPKYFGRYSGFTSCTAPIRCRGLGTGGRKEEQRTDKDVKVTRRRRAPATLLGWREEKGRIKDQKSASKSEKKSFHMACPCKLVGMHVGRKSNTDVSEFCRFQVTSRASHDYLLGPTTTCWAPRLPAASHDYLLPPTTASFRPSLMTAQKRDFQKKTQ